MDVADSCPCGTGRAYTDCCGPLHAGAEATTAVALMRSRFSAYALRLPDHLRRTWHPDTRPTRLDLDDGIVWRRLQIVDTASGGETDADGVVEFRASYRTPEGAGVLRERSRFRRIDGRWVYVDGDILEN